MNKQEIRKILKPLIKQCIKEVIFEEGTLSTIISEVLKGTSGELIKESKSNAEVARLHEQKQKQIQKNRKKMLDSIGKDAYNGVDLFEGTTPVTPERQVGSGGSKALEGVDPRDPGVDLSGFGFASNAWKKLAGN